MHVHRLLVRLVKKKAIKYSLCDYKHETIFSQLRKIRSSDVMHIHVSNPFLKLSYVIAGKIFKTCTLITLHGKYGVYGRWRDYIHKLALKYCDVPVLINHESYEAVKAINHNAVYIPAFIPPIAEEEVLPLSLCEMINSIKSDGKPLFVTNASSRAFTEDGREVYGIDFLISFFSKHDNYNLVVLDPNNSYGPLYEDRLPDNVWLIFGSFSFCGLISNADFVIRNTPTDGDSLSVKEALYLHKPVLATDAVSRPEGVFLFHYSDEESLEKAFKSALSYSGEIGLDERDATEAYYELYHKFDLA